MQIFRIIATDLAEIFRCRGNLKHILFESFRNGTIRLPIFTRVGKIFVSMVVRPPSDRGLSRIEGDPLIALIQEQKRMSIFLVTVATSKSHVSEKLEPLSVQLQVSL